MYEFLDKLNLQKDDVLLVASNIIPLAFEFKKNGLNFNPDEFIDELKKRVSTLLFPAFTYDFCDGKTFDYKNTPPSTLMGTLSLSAFKRGDFKRTKHPVFSFMVWGKYHNEFVSLENIDAFSMESPFGLLYKLKAKMLLINIEYNFSLTYVHFVEHQENAPYRYHKSFKADYIDENGDKTEKIYNLLVRDIEKGVVNNINPTGKILEQNNIAKKYILNNSEFILIDLEKSYDIIAQQVKNNPFNLMKIVKE